MKRKVIIINDYKINIFTIKIIKLNNNFIILKKI